MYFLVTLEIILVQEIWSKHNNSVIFKFRVILGKHHFNQTDNSEEVYNVEEIKKHDSADIALLKLERDVVETTYIKPARLATSLPSNGSSVTLIGWGQTKSGANPDVLKRATIFM